MKIYVIQFEVLEEKRMKIFGFQVVAEMIENQTKETFGDAGGEENEPEICGRIDLFPEFVDGNDRGGFSAARRV